MDIKDHVTILAHGSVIDDTNHLSNDRYLLTISEPLEPSKGLLDKAIGTASLVKSAIAKVESTARTYVYTTVRRV